MTYTTEIMTLTFSLTGPVLVPDAVAGSLFPLLTPQDLTDMKKKIAKPLAQVLDADSG